MARRLLLGMCEVVVIDVVHTILVIVIPTSSSHTAASVKKDVGLIVKQLQKC